MALVGEAATLGRFSQLRTLTDNHCSPQAWKARNSDSNQNSPGIRRATLGCFLPLCNPF